MVVDFAREVDSQDDTGVTLGVVVGGVGAFKDDVGVKLIQGNVGVHVGLFWNPLQVHLVRGVAEAFVLDLTDLFVDWILVKVHIAGDVIIYPGRISEEHYVLVFME